MMGANLHTTTAETLAHGEPDEVFAGVERLVEGLWPSMTEQIVVDRPARLVHSVSTEGAVLDSWLTWELTATDSRHWTRVRLVHDEADTAAGPPPELDIVLRLLLESLDFSEPFAQGGMTIGHAEGSRLSCASRSPNVNPVLRN